MSDIRQQLYLLVRDFFLLAPEFPISDATSAFDVDGWDSLSHAVFISAVERHFHVTLDVNRTLTMQHLGELVSALEMAEPGGRSA